MTKVHFHTDCSYFAGCENMIAVLTNSKIMRENFTISLSFRYSIEYERGASRRLIPGIQIFPLKLRELSIESNFFNQKRKQIKRILRFIVYLVELVTACVNHVIELVRVFRRVRPDILHINNGGYPGALSCRLAVLAAHLTRVKVVILVVNNMALPYTSLYRKVDYIYDRWLSRNVTLFITGSEIARLQLKTVLKLSNDKIRAVPNGVEIQETTDIKENIRRRLGIPVSTNLIFGIVGVMLPRKGHLSLLKAILILHEDNFFLDRHSIFLIEGDGPLKDELKNFVQINHISHLVKFVESMDNIFDFYKLIDVLIYPSIVDEDFPNVISEAMGMGKPVIASRVAGASEQILDKVTGFTFEKGDVFSLAAKIKNVHFNPNLVQNMGVFAAERFSKRYTKAVAEQAYFDIYRNMQEKYLG